MADYVGTFFISKLPFCFEKQEMINGVEKTCLVIPCDEAQLDRTRYGAWFLRLKCAEVPPNPQQRAIKLKLGYRNKPEVEKARRLRYYKETLDMGYLFVDMRDGDDSRKRDKTNNMTHIFCDGKLFLDSIQREDIKVDPQTGRKYVDFAFRKTQYLDAFGNSHEVIVRNDYGEHQIGVAKEIRNNECYFTQPTENGNQQQSENKQTPSEYDGYIW